MGNLWTKGGVFEMSESKNRNKAQRNKEPETISTWESGTHPAGNYITEQMSISEQIPRIEASGLIWFERDDLRKQGMTRGFRVDPRQAQAAPNRPHVGHVPGSGEIQ